MSATDSIKLPVSSPAEIIGTVATDVIVGVIKSLPAEKAAIEEASKVTAMDAMSDPELLAELDREITDASD
jgi:hypothetical protein